MLAIIVAMDKNMLIGNSNALPWHLPADLQYFKKLTTGKTIIMGRKTFDSIGRPLPNRENIILTRDNNLQIQGCKTINNLTEIANFDDAFVIGGSNIYQQTIDMIDKLYITQIDGEFKGDAYFPAFDKSKWQLVDEIKCLQDDKNPYNYNFLTFIKR